VNIEDLSTDDSAVVMTKLPWDTVRNMWQSAELRFLGYRFFDERWMVERPFKGRFKAIDQDYKSIAQEIGAAIQLSEDGTSIVRKKSLGIKHPLTVAAIELEWDRVLRVSNMHAFPRLVPNSLRLERLENIRIFLQSMVAQWAEFKAREVRIDAKYNKTAIALQELFLRCGVEMRIEDTWLITATETAAYRLYTEFELLGVVVNPSMPDELHRSEMTRLDQIVSIEQVTENSITYAIYVYDYHNYISGNIVCHNSLVLEDKQMYYIFNQDFMYPDTKELLLATANQSQLEPVYGRLITRCATSPLFKDFLGSRIKRSL
jgi:hypothetical protein